MRGAGFQQERVLDARLARPVLVVPQHMHKLLSVLLGLGLWVGATRALGADAEAYGAGAADGGSPPPTAFAPAAQNGDVLSTFGIHIGAGFGLGGDTLAEVTYADGSTSELKAGQGLWVGGGLTWTPWWPTDRLGFGLGYDVGYKLGTTGGNANGAIEFERIPMMLSARGLVALAGNYHFLLAGGGIVEFGPKLYGTGAASSITEARFSDAVGGMVEAGILFGRPLGVGGEITGRATIIEYDFQGTTVSGLSGGMNFNLHFFL